MLMTHKIIYIKQTDMVKMNMNIKEQDTLSNKETVSFQSASKLGDRT